MLLPPDNVEIYESNGGSWWISDNILYSIGKKDAFKPTKEEEVKELEQLKKIIGDKKICMVLDVTYARPTTKNDRDLAAVELEKLVKAMAMVTVSPLGRMVANLFFGLKPPSYPIKMFNNAEEAKVWIKQYV